MAKGIKAKGFTRLERRPIYTRLVGSAHALSAQSLIRVGLFVTLWTADHWAPLSRGFSRQKYWNGLPFLPPGDFPTPRLEPTFPALAGRFFTTETLGKP